MAILLQGKYPKVFLVTYHSVSDRTSYKYNISPALFERHLDFFKSNKFISLKCADLLRIRNNSSGKFVVITFDDGYQNNFTTAIPLLEKYGLTATFFVTSGYISEDESRRKIIHSLPMMIKSELIEIYRLGYEIGAHSASHTNLACLKDSDLLIQEITVPKQQIESMICGEVVSYALPFGHKDSYNAKVIEIIRNSGFKLNFTQMGNRLRYPFDPMQIPRIGIKQNENTFVIWMKSIGFYYYLKLISLVIYKILNKLNEATHTELKRR